MTVVSQLTSSLARARASALVLLVVLPLALLACPAVDALPNGLGRTPITGWMTWERFRCNVDCVADPDGCLSEQLILAQARALVSLNLAERFPLLWLDDCVMALNRTADGRLEADPSRFPSGMAALVEQLHALGLRVGVYADYGTETCGGYPGMMGHEEVDVATMAKEWQVDALKLDGCNSDAAQQASGYPLVSRLLLESGRAIYFSASWPVYQVLDGVQPNLTYVGEIANSWRYFDDVQDSWDSVLSIVDYTNKNGAVLRAAAGPGHFNDPDQLLVGDYGLSSGQQRAQLSLWAIFAAPWLLSVDLRNIDSEALALLQNVEVWSIQQDPLGVQGALVGEQTDPQSGMILAQVYARPLGANATTDAEQVAVVLFNRLDAGGPTWLSFTLDQIGLSSAPVASVRDVWAHADLGTTTDGAFGAMVPPVGVRMFLIVATPTA